MSGNLGRNVGPGYEFSARGCILSLNHKDSSSDQMTSQCLRTLMCIATRLLRLLNNASRKQTASDSICSDDRDNPEQRKILSSFLVCKQRVSQAVPLARRRLRRRSNIQRSGKQSPPYTLTPSLYRPLQQQKLTHTSLKH